ncbi:MAG: hypothetical protein P9L88_04940 [Candidatus Tantalella remota]|nr:hypothetical protein [Candidatus Tantalella remota]
MIIKISSIIFLFTFIFSTNTIVSAQIIDPNRRRDTPVRTTQEGDTTYYFDAEGRKRGYSRTEGDLTYDFGPKGQQRGYSRREGGITYKSGNQGQQRGTFLEVPEEEEVPQPESSGSPKEAQAGGFPMEAEGRFWGFAGPEPAANDNESSSSGMEE